MSELDKNKAGLQKNVSSVFKGVPVPQNNGSQKPSGSQTPESAHGIPKHLSLRTASPQNLRPQIYGLRRVL